MKLYPNHKQELLDSGITEPIIEAMGCYTETLPENLIQLGFSEGQSKCVPCLVFPNHSFSGNCYQIKPDHPFRDDDGKAIKYMTARGGSYGLSFIPHLEDNILDPAQALWITEGAKKMACASSYGLICLSLSGVWMWQKKDENGNHTPLEDWDVIPLKDRDVYLCFDSDAMHKAEVYSALKGLLDYLNTRGASVHIVYLPDGEEGEKTGLDDYLVSGHSVDDLYSLSDDVLRPLVADITQEVVKSLQKRNKGFAEVSACGVTFTKPDQKSLDKVVNSVSGVRGQVQGLSNWILGDVWIAMKGIVEHGHLLKTFEGRYGKSTTSIAKDAAVICRKFPIENRRAGAVPYWVFHEIQGAEADTQSIILDMSEGQRLSRSEIRTIMSNMGIKDSSKSPAGRTNEPAKSSMTHELKALLEAIPVEDRKNLLWFLTEKGYDPIHELVEAALRQKEAEDAEKVYNERFQRGPGGRFARKEPESVEN